MAYKSNADLKNALALALGENPYEDEFSELQRKINKITSRLFKELLTPAERMLADQLGTSYLDVLKRKRKNAAQQTNT